MVGKLRKFSLHGNVDPKDVANNIILVKGTLKSVPSKYMANPTLMLVSSFSNDR